MVAARKNNFADTGKCAVCQKPPSTSSLRKEAIPIPFTGFTDEERRLRVRAMELNLRFVDIANMIGIRKQDVTAVIRGNSPSPAYIAEVYRVLGMDIPAGLRKRNEPA
ncbi:MAG: hypothetical protein FWC60_07270 [Firmicutes bacterium]|nr:hypothetical protein [Bacillota bacterium]